MLTAKRIPWAAFSVLLLASFVRAQHGASGGEWQAFGADLGSTKYTPLHQINEDNVGDLEIVWRRPALDAYYRSLNPEQRFSTRYFALPLVVDGVAYIPNGVGLVELPPEELGTLDTGDEAGFGEAMERLSHGHEFSISSTLP